MGLENGLLDSKSLYPLKVTPKDTPASSNEPKNPIKNRLKLTWKPKFAKTGGSPSVRSDGFSLGGESLTAYLELKLSLRDYHHYLYLQVPAKCVDGIIGRVIVHVVKTDPVSDHIISKTNVVNDNSWVLTPYSEYSTYDMVLNIEVDLEYVIIDCNQKHKFDPSDLKIIQDFALLLSDKDNMDITLKVDSGTELRAHKFMLSTRSPVLKTMLSADMLEGRKGVIELKNMSEAAATAFLSFIYSAHIKEQELAETAEELLPAAALYDMPDLFAYSESALRERINEDNVGRLLLLACLHGAVKLKFQALFFFKSNKAAVTASQGWKEVVAANPTVICEAFINFV